jgi:hypothetical protein
MSRNETTGTYDPKKVIINFGGIILGGFADGTFVEIAANDADGFKRKVGADGEVMRSLSADNTHSITVTLLQSSASNKKLSDVRNEDKVTGKGIKALTITDINGETMGFWPEAWIRGDPTLGFAKEDTERQWVFDTGQQGSSDIGGVMMP